MDNLTHTLAGLAISQAGFNRKTRYATFAIIVGANLPDIDLVSRIWGNVAYLEYHRGITHSIIGVTALAVLLASTVYFLGTRARPPKSGPPLNGGWLLLACWVATASHLLLDFTNSYGVRPFMPLNGHWYSWCIEPIVDPILWLILIAGLALPALFRLISEEVGARKTGFQRGAILSLCGLIALGGLRDFSHRRALNMLDAVDYGQTITQRIDAFPNFTNPFDWTGVVESSQAFYVLPVDVLAGRVAQQEARVYHKAEPSPALKSALATRTARVFMDFARFPWSEAVPSERGPTVIIRDLRFQPANSQRGGFAIQVQLNNELNVLSEEFSFTGRFRENQP
jgi:inner membrane protein